MKRLIPLVPCVLFWRWGLKSLHEGQVVILQAVCGVRSMHYVSILLVAGQQHEHWETNGWGQAAGCCVGIVSRDITISVRYFSVDDGSFTKGFRPKIVPFKIKWSAAFKTSYFYKLVLALVPAKHVNPWESVWGSVRLRSSDWPVRR